jgi:hypothetical protein
MLISEQGPVMRGRCLGAPIILSSHNTHTQKSEDRIFGPARTGSDMLTSKEEVFPASVLSHKTDSLIG